MMFRRIAIKLFIFQFRVYVFIKSLTKEYLPEYIYKYVFVKPTIQYDGGHYQAHRTDGTIQKVSGEKGTKTGRRGREAWDSYAYFASKSEKITRRKSLNDLQGMFKVSELSGNNMN
jgi:hypothetical protein